MADEATDVVVCSVRELDASGACGFAIGTGEWPLRGLVLRDATGIVQAYVDRCPHAGHPLALKDHDFLTPDRAFIKCSSHGALFERDTGICVAGPCPGRTLRRLQVRVDGEDVRIAPPV
jgi:hypothetical protein